MNFITIQRIFMIFVLCIAIPETGGAQSTQHIERAGDVLQIAIPLTAYGMTVAYDDHIGRRRLYASLASTLGSTYALKYAIPEERPDGGTLSFVSGHTSAAFAGAAFIQRRYGWKFGIPAYMGAGFVGWSRVEARKHHPGDVLRGAALGTLSSYLLTKSYGGRFRVSSLLEERKMGLAFQFLW